MKSIPDDVLDLIAGGRTLSSWGASTTGIPTVTIPAPDRPSEPWYPSDPFGGGDSGGGGGGTGGEPSGSGDGSGPHHRTAEPKYAPANVNMDQLRNTVLEVATHLKDMANKDGKEHGALIVRTADGSLKVGEFSTGTEEKNTAGIGIAEGDKIVAWVHDHPYTIGVDERGPSKWDIGQFQDLQSNKLADPNTLMYIVDMESGDTFEYQKGVRFGRVGSNISHDF
jgi:hypothetical protein